MLPKVPVCIMHKFRLEPFLPHKVYHRQSTEQLKPLADLIIDPPVDLPLNFLSSHRTTWERHVLRCDLPNRDRLKVDMIEVSIALV